MVCIAFQFVVGCIALEITVLCKNTSTVFHNTLSVQNRVWLAYVVQIVLCCFVLHLHYNSASQYFAIYAQRKTVCDLRLLFRLSDLNGQIPPPLSQIFPHPWWWWSSWWRWQWQRDDDDDDNDHGGGDKGGKIIQLWQDPWFDLWLETKDQLSHLHELD